MPFSKIFPSSRSLNLLKKGLESPGKVLEFHLHQSVDTLVRLLFYTLFIIASAGKKRRSSKENVARSNDVINKVLQTTFGKFLTKAGVTLASGEVQNKISKSQLSPIDQSRSRIFPRVKCIFK
jgi:hypothetical protein